MDQIKQSRDSLTDQVERKLRQIILAGKIPPKTRLNIRILSEQLGTSVTPVREALMRLSAQRIIDAQPGKFSMPDISRERYIEICNLRILLEGHAGEIAATRITQKELLNIRSLAETYIQAVLKQDYALAVEHNARFKLAVFAAAHMPTLTALIESLMLQVTPFFIASITPPPNTVPESPPFSVRYTTQILEGLAVRDGQRVRHALQGMILIGTERVMANLGNDSLRDTDGEESLFLKGARLF